MQKNTRKKTAIVAGLVLAVAGAGAAYAYWTAGGSGTGSASTGTTTGITVNQTSTVSDMRPGDSPQTLSGDFTNTNDGPVYVTSVVASIGDVTKAQGAPAGTCTADDYTLANATMTVGTEVASGTNVGDWTGATIQFNNTAANQDACKGATVAINYSVN
jgi:hypothetical protein